MVLTIGEGVALTFNTEMQESDKVGVATPSTKNDQSSSVSQISTTAAPTCTRSGRGTQVAAT